MAIANGKEINKARKDVNNVPARKAIAPNLSYTGSQVVPYIKLRPNFFIAGKESRSNVMKTAERSINMHKPEKKSIFLNMDSDKFEYTLVCFSIFGWNSTILEEILFINIPIEDQFRQMLGFPDQIIFLSNLLSLLLLA